MNDNKNTTRKLTLSHRIGMWFEFHFLQHFGWYMLAGTIVLFLLDHLGFVSVRGSRTICPYGRGIDAC